MKNKTKQRLKNGITTGLSAGLIGYLAKGPRTGLALGGAMGLAAALQDPSKQKEIDDIVDLRQKEKHAMTRLSKEMLQSFVEEVEKTAGIPKGLRELARATSNEPDSVKKQFAKLRYKAHLIGKEQGAAGARTGQDVKLMAVLKKMPLTKRDHSPATRHVLKREAIALEKQRDRDFYKAPGQKNKKASAGVEEVEKTAGLPSYLKKMTKKEFGVTKITEWPKDRRLQDVLSQHQAGKQLPLVGKAQKGRAAKEVRERSAAGFREGTAEHKWKNSKNSLKSKTAGIPKGLRELAKKKQRWGAGEYAVRREAAHKFGNKATKPRKYEIWATGSGLEARTPKNPNPSQLSVKADVNEGKRWRKMSKEQLGKFEKTKTSGAASIAGLSGLVALEGSGAFNKKKSTKERAMSGAAGAATGAILGDELMHHPSIGPKLRSGFNAAKGLLTKKAAPSQAAMMKMHAMVDASKAAKNVAPAAAQGTLRPASQAAHAGYADFMPAGRFSGAGQGLPSIQQRSMQHAQKVMAAGGGKMAPLQRVSAGAAQTGGVLGRIGKMFRGA